MRFGPNSEKEQVLTSKSFKLFVPHPLDGVHINTVTSSGGTLDVLVYLEPKCCTSIRCEVITNMVIYGWRLLPIT